jgi:hypothetical protein
VKSTLYLRVLGPFSLSRDPSDLRDDGYQFFGFARMFGVDLHAVYVRGA